MSSESSIEIFQRTLLKLLIRRGVDADRRNVVLGEGEIGFTTDTHKLYVGDGVTYGGHKVTGSRFIGYTGDITTLGPADINDIAFSTSDNTLYYISSGDGTLLSHWTEVGGIYSNIDGTIAIDSAKRVSLGDVAGQSIEKDEDNKITLADTIYIDNIAKKTNEGEAFLGLPRKITFGSNDYNFPVNAVSNGYLKLNDGGELTWSSFISETTNSFVNSEVFPVGSIIPYASTTLPSNGRFLRCDGSYVLATSYPVLSAVLGTTYGALSTVGPNTYFKLPSLQGKTTIGFGGATDLSGTNRSFTIGASGGMYSATLTQSNIPAHTHNTVSNTISVSAFGGVNSYVALNGGNYNLSATSVVPTLGQSTSWGASSVTAVDVTSPYLVTNYIIKAIADPSVSCTFTLFDSITASFNGNQVSTINPLSGDYVLGLATVLSAANLGGINVNNKGQVVSYDTSIAGATGTALPNSTPLAHEFGYINFLRTAVPIVSNTIFGATPTSWIRTFSAFPAITTATGANGTPLSNIPRNAKNIILDIQGGATAADSCLIAAAQNEGRLGSNVNTIVAGTEYPIFSSGTSGSSRYYQATIPLSGTHALRTFALRGYNAADVGLTVRVVGWTL